MRRMIVALGAAAVLVLPGASVAHASAALWTVLPTPYDGNSSDTDLVGVSCPAASDCTALSSDGAALQWRALGAGVEARARLEAGFDGKLASFTLGCSGARTALITEPSGDNSGSHRAGIPGPHADSSRPDFRS